MRACCSQPEQQATSLAKSALDKVADRDPATILDLRNTHLCIAKPLVRAPGVVRRAQEGTWIGIRFERLNETIGIQACPRLFSSLGKHINQDPANNLPEVRILFIFFLITIHPII